MDMFRLDGCTALVTGCRRGIGLAVAVFLDAFILRTFLVPSAMHLFGRANWWLPAAVDKRMPHLSVEPTEDAEQVVAVTDDDEVCTMV